MRSIEGDPQRRRLGSRCQSRWANGGAPCGGKGSACGQCRAHRPAAPGQTAAAGSEDGAIGAPRIAPGIGSAGMVGPSASNPSISAQMGQSTACHSRTQIASSGSTSNSSARQGRQWRQGQMVSPMSHGQSNGRTEAGSSTGSLSTCCATVTLFPGRRSSCLPESPHPRVSGKSTPSRAGAGHRAGGEPRSRPAALRSSMPSVTRTNRSPGCS
jgi:hypothetical protein